MTSKAFGLAQLGNAYADGALSNRNKVINGGMTIDQRNAGASYTQVNSAYSLDRWSGNSYDGGAVASKFSVQRSTTAPTGFFNSMLATSLSASATTTSDIYNIEQKIEGFNTSDLMYGTANAVTTTLSFWVRSSLTGTFGGAIKNEARNRAYPFTYTINAANTFEYKTITIPGDTTGTWVGGTNGTGIWLSFGLGVGSSFSGTAGAWGAGDLFSATGAQYLISTSGATFYITGVQLEAGDTATPFEHRSYGQELALCQRYALVLNSNDSNLANRMGFGMSSGATNAYCQIRHPVPMRAKPSLTTVIAAGQTINLSDTAAATTTTSLAYQVITSDVNQTQIDATVASGLTAFRPYYLEFGGAGSTLTLSAEL